MVTFRELVSVFRKLDLDRTRPAIIHASLSAFGEVQGGAETVLGALLAAFDSLLMPAFTYRTMLTPESGPPGNGMIYGSGRDLNRMAEFYRPDVPADPLIGVIAEALRCHPKAKRSLHPILSFTGINVDTALDSQSLEEPLAPIRVLTAGHGYVLLLGVGHTVNTSIHYAERLAGRKQFLRWALTPRGVVACPGFPGCSDGFQAVEPRLSDITRWGQVGNAQIQAIPLAEMIDRIRSWIAAEPSALLCDRLSCERCESVRQGLSLPLKDESQTPMP